jgi:hypothetical protein
MSDFQADQLAITRRQELLVAADRHRFRPEVRRSSLRLGRCRPAVFSAIGVERGMSLTLIDRYPQRPVSAR